MLTRRRSERGASSIELVLYTPIMFFVIFLIIQFALHYHGGQVAHAAAREGARVARIGGGSAESLAQAESKARDYANAIGGNQLTVTRVSAVALGNGNVRVEVCGRAKEIIRNMTPTVCRHVEGPIEEFRPDL